MSRSSANSNPTLVAADELAAGKIEIATQVEVDAGTNDTKAITPLKLANYPVSSTIAYSETTLTTTTSTTSASYIVVNGMTFTPAAGTWLAIYSAAGMISSKETSSFFGIFNNGTIVSNSERCVNQGGNHDHPFDMPVYTATMVTTTGSEAIDVRYKTADGTFTMKTRSLVLIKMSG